MATRAASGKVLNAAAAIFPSLMGGSADLAPSNKTFIDGSPEFQKKRYDGRNIRFGVREFAMGAVMSGMFLHGGIRPYGGTFLVFADYMRPAIRVAALMKLPVIYVFTHDSVAVGEDGPTHQPVEQIPTLRMIPNMAVWRPCDAVESAVSWQQAIERKEGPSCLIFSRQGLPHQTRTDAQIANITKGGYILGECDSPDAIIIATGSEVALAMDAAAAMGGKKIRVVSMPSTNIFDAQDDAYKASVLPKGVPTLAVEAAVTDGWYKYADKVVGIDHFGESAPADQLFKEFGFTVENVVAAVESII